MNCSAQADVVLAPSAPGEAPHGLGSTGDPQFNRAWQLLGGPQINVPVPRALRRSRSDLPLGVQVDRPSRRRCARAECGALDRTAAQTGEWVDQWASCTTRNARFDTTASVVVIGAGGAGATAALAARSAGADVLVLDRDAAPSGATACSSGMVPAAGTAEQKARGIADSPQRFADDIQAKANGSADAPLVKALTDASAKVLEWLTKQYGIRFELVEGVAPGHSLSRMHALADRGGSTLLSSLYSALGTQGVRMESAAHATDLVVDDAQRIIGVRYKRGSKSRVGWVHDVDTRVQRLCRKQFAGGQVSAGRSRACRSRATTAVRATLLRGALHSTRSLQTSMDSWRTVRWSCRSACRCRGR